MKIHHLKRCPLSKSDTFDQNFMKLGHIVKYHDVFFKFDNGPYRTMPSVIIALWLWKFFIWNYVHSLSRIYWQTLKMQHLDNSFNLCLKKEAKSIIFVVC